MQLFFVVMLHRCSSDNEWTWLGPIGSKQPYQVGVYSGPSAVPGARLYAAGWLYDSDFYLFSGEGFSTEPWFSGYHNVCFAGNQCTIRLPLRLLAICLGTSRVDAFERRQHL